MPYRSIEFRAGHVYHLYNRGVNRGPIFFCKENWSYFVRQLHRYFRYDLVDILAYCLMPTHYHLMIYRKKPGFLALAPPGTSAKRPAAAPGPLRGAETGFLRRKLRRYDAYLPNLPR